MKSIHNDRLEMIVANPVMIGLNTVDKVIREFPVYDSKGVLKLEIDALIFKGQNLYVVEYKCNSGVNSRIKAQSQLEIARELLPLEQLKPTHLFYVYDWEPVYVDRLITLNDKPRWSRWI